MSLILGAVCDDGVVIAADSKFTPYGGGKATYKSKKIITVGGIAIAMAGVANFESSAKAISSQVRGLLRLNPNIPLSLIATEMCKWCANFLIVEEAYLSVLLANNKEMFYLHTRYHKGLPEAWFDKVDSAIAGIEDVKYLSYKGPETTEAYSGLFKAIIRLNKGSHVGGRTQVIILNG
jgi:hypothetical protein